MKRSIFLRAAMIAGISIVASGSHAAVANPDQCSYTGTNGKSGGFAFLEGAMAAECFNGNDVNTIDASTSLFGMTGWALNDKIDAEKGLSLTLPSGAIAFADGATDFDFTVRGDKASDEAQGGSIFADLSSFSFAFIVLKAGNGFGAFKVAVGESAWNWRTQKDISHVSIWTKGGQIPASPIPLPAGSLLLLTGLAALGLGKRKAKRATA